MLLVLWAFEVADYNAHSRRKIQDARKKTIPSLRYHHGDNIHLYQISEAKFQKGKDKHFVYRSYTFRNS